MPISAASRNARRRASRRYHCLFRPGTYWLWGYAWSKFRLDPAYLQVAELVPAGTLTLDLGSGLAMLPALLVELGEGRQAVAMEWDQTKVRAAQRVLRDVPEVQVHAANVLEADLPACDTAVIQDVLHYFPRDIQDGLLARAFSALRPGGRLILRETESRPGGGSSFTRSLEWLAIHCGWNHGPELHYRSRPEWQACLESMGLERVQALDSSLVTPGNVLMHGTKPLERP
jgi:SAM-dependent methyltransferase